MMTSLSAPPAENAVGAPDARTVLVPRGGLRRAVPLQLLALAVLAARWALAARRVMHRITLRGDLPVGSR